MSATVALAAQHGGHAAGPSSTWEAAIAIGAGVVVAIALVLAVKMLIRPGEKSKDHIKRTILDDSATRRHDRG